MTTRFHLLTGILLLIASHTYTQALPEIKPPTPSAMQFQKYGDYPVSHFTGVPDITIPLYTIKEGDLEVPVTLTYHGSGFRLSDVDGIVGLGWVLNVGGQITRTIYDKDDEETSHTLTNSQPLPTESYVNSMIYPYNMYSETYLDQIESKFMYDIFSFDFLSKHGKFIMKDHDLNQCTLLEYQPLQITGIKNSPHISSFTVKDEAGKTYFFGDLNHPVGSGNSEFWCLSSIKSAIDSTNIITYSYVQGPTSTYRSRVDVYTKDDAETDPAFDMCSQPIPIYNLMQFDAASIDISYTDNGYAFRVPSQITFRSGRIQFIYDGVTKLLSTMEVYNASNELIKRFRFDLYKRGPSSGRPFAFLKKIKLHDRNDNFVNEYSFLYEDENFYLPDVELMSVDYWGYYNEGGEPNLIPKWYIENQNYYNGNLGSGIVGSSDRRSSEVMMKKFQLNEIKYPTGGRTVFEFEANRYNGMDGPMPTGYNQTMVGGLRIKKISSYTDSTTLAGMKEYEYVQSRMDIIPSRPYFTRSERRHFLRDDMEHFEAYRRIYVSSEPLVNIAPHGSPVVYPLVKEHIRKFFPDGSFDPAGTHTITYEYNYQPFNDYGFASSNGPEGNGSYPLYPPYLQVVKAMTDGKLIGETYEGPGTINSTFNDYEEIPLTEFPAFYSVRYAAYDPHPCPSGQFPDINNRPDYYFYQNLGSALSHLNYGDVTIKPVINRLKSTIETRQGVTTETFFNYVNNTHNQPSSKTVTNSKGETLLITYQYPHEKQSGGAPNVYNALVSRHIWNPVIEEATYISGTPNIFLQSATTNYDYWENNAWTSGSASSLIVPRTVQTKSGTNSIETRLRYHTYDEKANVLSASKENDVRMSYIWGHNYRYPIAEVVNAEAKDIFHTSFEDATGVDIAAEGKTGRKSKTGGYSKSLTNLANGSYVLSYWQKSGGNWIFTSATVNVAGNAYTINLSGQLDEIRFCPSSAVMTTFTTDPLIGKTSETNANNRTEHYEYDPALRLMHVLDEDRNVLKKFTYSFHNSATTSTTNPNWQNTGNNYCEPCNINPAFNSGYRMVEQTDNNPSSYTYGQTRWTKVSDNTCGNVSDFWVNTGTYRCVQDGGINTGEREQLQNFTNPCYYYEYYIQQSRWVSVGINTTACPVPSVWYNQDLSGYYTKNNCPPDYAGNDIYVSVPAGMFSSSTSLAHANLQAQQYAQNAANTSPSGTCTGIPFMLQCDNQTLDDIEITLIDPATNDEVYTFVAEGNYNGYQDLGNILPGTYKVKFLNLDYTTPYYYYLVCGTVTDDGYNITVPNVTIGSGCNTIEILY